MISHRPSRLCAFSFVELLFVLAIISVLAALLLPTLLTARGKARQVFCASNLRQIGMGITMYAQDNDGLYPYAVDPSDRAAPTNWSEYPEFATDIPRLGLIHQVIQPYIKSPEIFACPADIGFAVNDFSGVQLDAFPSSYEKFGISYYYRTEIAARHSGEMTFSAPEQMNVLFDGAGHWHGTLLPLEQRYNVLFADGHVKNLTYPQVMEAWNTPLQSN
jgi:general secretion pathway protein G